MSPVVVAAFAALGIVVVACLVSLGVEALRRPRWDETESFDDFRDALDPR